MSSAANWTRVQTVPMCELSSSSFFGIVTDDACGGSLRPALVVSTVLSAG